ncbi:hypothetical protein J2755_000298 [Methanohalophilus levihalophilus]|uniref:hypothetical protein n=1 Tax=Methanohalophilus levihalophilus TaxID=1431282 RepID=UPI001AE2E235|nr:hypothetical protein [Methanohalophilus levihalophilus]MBP2029378.1 hypothetical protein [Methanohalophilus levihalophilus]
MALVNPRVTSNGKDVTGTSAASSERREASSSRTSSGPTAAERSRGKRATITPRENEPEPDPTPSPANNAPSNSFIQPVTRATGPGPGVPIPIDIMMYRQNMPASEPGPSTTTPPPRSMPSRGPAISGAVQKQDSNVTERASEGYNIGRSGELPEDHTPGETDTPIEDYYTYRGQTKTIEIIDSKIDALKTRHNEIFGTSDTPAPTTPPRGPAISAAVAQQGNAEITDKEPPKTFVEAGENYREWVDKTFEGHEIKDTPAPATPRGGPGIAAAVAQQDGATQTSYMKNVAYTPAMFLDITGNAAIGTEIAVRDPTKVPEAAAFGVGVMAGGMVKLADEDPAALAGQLTGMVVGGKVLATSLRAGGKYIPRVEKAQITEVKGSSATPDLGKINFGHSVVWNERPVVTHVTGEGVRFHAGAGAAPAEAVAGRQVQAFTPAQTAHFKKTVEAVAGKKESEFFETGYVVSKSVYDTNRPIVHPERFDILSEHVPTSAKPAVKDTIVNYKGEIDVYGSVAQKLQMREYMTRKPQDIEVVVDKPQNFIKDLTAKLDESGIKHEVTGDLNKPKVQFFVKGEKVKGIEIFPKEEHSSGYSPGREIAFGFEHQKPIYADGVNMLRLSEQAARKLEGGHTLKDNQILPKHEGRVKDVRDLVEIGSAYAAEGKANVGPQIVRYTELAVEKFPEIRESPVVDFIAKNRQIPDKSVIRNMISQERTAQPKELIFTSSARSSSRGNMPSMDYFPSVPSTPSTPSSVRNPGSSLYSPPPSSMRRPPTKTGKPPYSPYPPASTKSSPPYSPSSSSSIVSPPSDMILLPEFSEISSPFLPEIAGEGIKQTKRGKLKGRETNIYNRYGDPLKAANAALKSTDAAMKELNKKIY